jgi:Domain of unknown function (DUF4112)
VPETTAATHATYREAMTDTTGGGRTVTSLPRTAAARHQDRSARLAAAERRIGAISHVLDDLVTLPGTGRRVGVEPVIGLVPGAGDVISAAVGVWLIVEATRFKLPKVVVIRMALNTLVDFVVGLVPILGDLFDFAFKSNSRNVALFRRYAADPEASTREHTLVLVGAVVALVGIAWLFLAAIGWLLSFVIALA